MKDGWVRIRPTTKGAFSRFPASMGDLDGILLRLFAVQQSGEWHNAQPLCPRPIDGQHSAAGVRVLRMATIGDVRWHVGHLTWGMDAAQLPQKSPLP